MKTRFVRSFYLLAVIALAWVGAIIALNLGYLEPSIKSESERIEQATGGRWLREANSFLNARRRSMLRLTKAWAAEVNAPSWPGGDKSDPASLSARSLAGGEITSIALCDWRGKVTRAWRVCEGGKLIGEARLGGGADLRSLPIFRSDSSAEEVTGISRSPIGAVLFARFRLPGSKTPTYLVSFRPVDVGLLAELSAIVDAKFTLAPDAMLPTDKPLPTFGQVVWRQDADKLKAAQILRDSLGGGVGYLVAQGQTASLSHQGRSVQRALTVALLWAGGFAVLMVLAIHILVSGPTERLWSRIQRRRSGEKVEDLSANLRGEAWALAQEFEQALSDVEKLSQTDPLTNLANRRSFQELLEQEFTRALRYGRPLSVLVMDIDFFKAVNDAMGHHTGDEMLKLFADSVTSNVRNSDYVARLGGDEFAVLMPETDAQAAEVVVERVRETLAGKSVGADGVKMTPTTSVGIADMAAGSVDTPEEMMDLADQALYAAKRRGRNCYVHASELTDGPAEDTDDKEQVDRLSKQLAGLDAKFKRLFVDAIGSLIRALEMRDVHTADHSAKVRRYAIMIAEQMQMPEQSIEHLSRAAMLHDIGKIAMPDDVLLQDGRLTEDQWRQVQQHPVTSVKIMEGMEFLDQEMPTVLHHHERYDGSGYPEGIAGSAIPLGARILSVADAFDAMTSTRTFRTNKSVDEALEELRRGSGTHFDPGVVEAFLQVVADNPIVLAPAAAPVP